MTIDINLKNTNQLLLTRSEAAKMLGVKPETLAHWACVGRYNLPYVKIGRLVKYRTSDIQNFINNNSIGDNNE
jgi:excisionase family DNA binding protein